MDTRRGRRTKVRPEQKGQVPGAFTGGEGPAFSTGVKSGDSLWKGWFEMKGDKKILCGENYLKEARRQASRGHVERTANSTFWLDHRFRD